MLDLLLDFFSFTNPNVRFVVLGTALMGLASGLVGTFAVLRNRSLVGDAVAHSVLPGVALAFLIFDTKHIFVLTIGALLFGWLSLLCIDWISRNTKITNDSAIGMVLSVFFGFGALILSFIQNSGNAAQSGLNSFLFGQAAALVSTDVMMFSALSVLVVVGIALSYKELKLISFQPEFAQTLGLNVRFFEFLLSTLMVITIVSGLQAVGVILMAAMLIIPASAARYWSSRLSGMLLGSAIIGALSGVLGSFISYSAPSMPTGPWMVLSGSTFLIISLFFAPKKGLIARGLRHLKNRQRILSENILKTAAKLSSFELKAVSISEIVQRRPMSTPTRFLIFRWLQNRNWITVNEQGFLLLTETGLREAKRVIRLHRLWELYLTQMLDIKEDHVHDDAEAMEHVITPELESRLVRRLERPEKDPHDSTIPYDH